MPSKAAAPPVASLNTTKVQQDWANREFMETVQVGVAQLTAFLNRFGERCANQPLATQIPLHTS